MLIAELCQNHNGNIELLRRMTEAATENGATHVKIQHIYADELVFRAQFEEGLEAGGQRLCIRRPYQPEHNRLKGLELSDETIGEFVRHCRSLGVVPMTTCFTRVRIPNIRAAGFEVVKVASPDVASYTMHRELARGCKQIVLSTGGAFDDEIRDAARVLQETGIPFALLHCVMNYPTALEDVNLACMDSLRPLAPQVGFSDHTLVARDGILASKAALALGADIIERHFTILGPDKSKDRPVSIQPRHLKELSDFGKLPQAERAAALDREWPEWQRIVHGTGDRALSHPELLNRAYYRGRFASKRDRGAPGQDAIYNGEKTPLPQNGAAHAAC